MADSIDVHIACQIQGSYPGAYGQKAGKTQAGCGNPLLGTPIGNLVTPPIYQHIFALWRENRDPRGNSAMTCGEHANHTGSPEQRLQPYSQSYEATVPTIIFLCCSLLLQWRESRRLTDETFILY